MSNILFKHGIAFIFVIATLLIMKHWDMTSQEMILMFLATILYISVYNMVSLTEDKK